MNPLNIADSDESEVPPPVESTPTRRSWHRFRFRLRTLLLLPLVVAALLLVAFPKLLTGDFVDAKVVSIEHNGGRVRLTIDARISSATGWGATILRGGSFGSLGVSGEPQPHWSHIIPTWPRHQSIVLNLGVRDQSSVDTSDPLNMLTIQQGESYRVTPDQPLEVAPQSCRFSVSRGSRLGL